MINFKGCVASPRDIYDWEYSHDPASMLLWFYLLHHANWKDKRWNGIVVKRGQLVTSIRSLSKKLRISEWKIRSALVRLKSTHLITQETSQEYTVISIQNYGVLNQNHTQNHTQTTHEPHILNKENKENNKYSSNFSSNKTQKGYSVSPLASLSSLPKPASKENPMAPMPPWNPTVLAKGLQKLKSTILIHPDTPQEREIA